MKKGDNVRLRLDGRYEARYIKGRNDEGKIIYGCCYGKTYEEAVEKRNMQLQRYSKKELNLLILGKGDHGKDAYDIAKLLRVFKKIDFLDDNPYINNTIGVWSDYNKFVNEYPVAIVAVGDEMTRIKWTEKLIAAGYVLPTLVHPTAYVPDSTVIGSGTIICARVTVSAGVVIGKGCIVTSGSTIPRKTKLPDWSYFEFDKNDEHYHEEYDIPREKGDS